MMVSFLCGRKGLPYFSLGEINKIKWKKINKIIKININGSSTIIGIDFDMLHSKATVLAPNLYLGGLN